MFVPIVRLLPHLSPPEITYIPEGRQTLFLRGLLKETINLKQTW